MKIQFFSSKPYDKEYFNAHNKSLGFELDYFETHLGPHSVNLVNDAEVICVFVNDKLPEEVIRVVAEKGVKIIALRCAGFNNVDLTAAKKYGVVVCRVPAYSPEAVAEHTAAMLLTINRKTHRAYNRVREQNFSLNGLVGFNLHGKTVGVVGTGKIGKAFIKIMQGFGCKVIAYDLYPDESLTQTGVTYLDLNELLKQSDVVSLHCPLTAENHHLINKDSINLMKPGVALINTSRGGLINTADVIGGLKSKQIGALCVDVYEQEEKLFFRDLSSDIIDDDLIMRLMSFPNVLVSAHQAFLTEEALVEIAQVTLSNIQKLSEGTMPSGSLNVLT